MILHREAVRGSPSGNVLCNSAEVLALVRKLGQRLGHLIEATANVYHLDDDKRLNTTAKGVMYLETNVVNALVRGNECLVVCEGKILHLLLHAPRLRVEDVRLLTQTLEAISTIVARKQADRESIRTG